MEDLNVSSSIPILETQQKTNKRNLIEESSLIPNISSKSSHQKMKMTAHVIEEDVIVSRVAFPILELPSSKDERLRKVSGNLWDCIGLQESSEGLVYMFDIKPDYKTAGLTKEEMQVIQQKKETFFPALEPLEGNIFVQMSVFEKNKIKENTFKEGVSFQNFKQIAEFLGYQFKLEGKRHILYLPDPKMIQHRLEKLGELIHPEACFDFKVFVCSGVLDDISFVEAYNENDVVLSSDKEFLHDSIYHLFPLLNVYFEDRNEYRKVKNQLIVQNRELINKIKLVNEEELKNDEKVYLKLIKVGVGVRNDAIAVALSNGFYKKMFNGSNFENLLGKHFWQKDNKWTGHLMRVLEQIRGGLKKEDEWIVTQFKDETGPNNLVKFLKKITT